jgi:hypothetical protein
MSVPIYLCVHWPHRGKQCRKRAAGMLYAPDGIAVPGGYYCQRHASAIMKEYREKLGEFWTLKPLDHAEH